MQVGANSDTNEMILELNETTGCVHFQNVQTASDLYHRIIKVFEDLQQLDNDEVDAVLDRYGVRYLPRY